MSVRVTSTGSDASPVVTQFQVDLRMEDIGTVTLAEQPRGGQVELTVLARPGRAFHVVRRHADADTARRSSWSSEVESTIDRYVIVFRDAELARQVVSTLRAVSSPNAQSFATR